jgi:outer membrane protein OmpA-like peptidoglycan-associated protein
MTQKAATPQGAGDLLGMLTKVTGDSTMGNVASLLAGGSNLGDLAKVGAPLVASLLGGQQAGIINWLASAAGIGKGSAGSLLGLLAPMVMSGLGKYLTSSGGGLNASALSSLFASQASSLLGNAPAGLAGALGVASLADLTRAPQAAVRAVEEAKDSGLGFLKWVLPLIAIAALLAYMLSGRSTVENATTAAADAAANASSAVTTAANSAADTAAAATAGAATAVTDAAASLGAMVERNLPSLPAIRVPENGIESKLLIFITDASRPVDTTTWFSFDRLEFDTASATLRPSSNEQLDAMAAILKAYPNVNLKIGGYTDSVGDDAANQKLSAARAETTMQALVTRGTAPGRLEAEGYGEQHPVASNDTEEGRQRNRRIDVRVTKK